MNLAGRYDAAVLHGQEVLALTQATYVQPELNSYLSNEFLVQHLRNLNLRRRGESHDQVEDREYRLSSEFWKEVIAGTTTALRWVRLTDFQISGWFPRSPGLFRTDFATFQRTEAERHVVEQEGARFYDPGGKFNMIQGGLGSVRFQNIEIESEDSWLCTATNDGYCHTGIPLLVPDRLLKRYRLDTGDRFSITGKLRFMPPFLSQQFGHLTRVPQLYVHIDRLERTSGSPGEQFITPMVFFTTHPPGENRVAFNVTYVTCLANDYRDIDAGINWLTWYTEHYQGEIQTNFDQQRPAFENTPFSLQKVMTGRAELTRLNSLIDDGTLRTELVQATSTIVVTGPVYGDVVGGDKVGRDKYEIGQAGNVGHVGPVGSMPLMEGKTTMTTASWVFGTILLLFLIGFVFWNPENLHGPQQMVVRLLGSVFAGLISAFFVGNLHLKGNVPGLKKVTLAAAGGFAVFCLVFFLWK